MSMNEQMNHAEESILHTYNRFPVMFDHGEGCYLYDTEGKKYLDFAAGIAVNALGYHYPGYDEALKAQIDKLTHISNLYYNEPMSEAGEKLVKASGLAKAFFTNSGTEAIEGALKAARKYAYTKYGKEAQKYEIIAMNHSFHGRSMGALSVTGTEHYREPFEPLIGGVKFADFNDLESVKAQITDKTCAIITEVVQGEGGRVGRGEYQSYCIFIQGNQDQISKRLEILNKSNDGFYIAGEDLKLRGPGDLFGIRQSGDMEFRIGDIYNDSTILKEASEAAEEILSLDPELDLEQHRSLRERMEHYSQNATENIAL